MPLEKFPSFTLPEQIRRRRATRVSSDYTWRAIVIMVLGFAAAFFLLLALSGAYAEESTPMYVNTKADPLNVRERPNIHSEIVARLDRGEAVEVVRIEGGWALIKGVGELGEGWASAKYLADRPPDVGLVLTVEED